MKFWGDIESLHLITSQLKYPWKLLMSGMIFFIIAMYLLVFKLSFYHHQNYWLWKVAENTYVANVLLKDYQMWKNKKTLRYLNREYKYQVISEEAPFVEGKSVYSPLKIKIESLNEEIPLIEVSIVQDKVTIWNYLKRKVKEE